MSEYNLNPDIRKVNIGVRDLREITIYPLSLADEYKMTDIISESLVKFNELSNATNVELVTEVINFIKKHLSAVLELVTKDEESENLLTEITNNQAVEIATHIYQVNFEVLSKNVSSLLKRAEDQPIP